MYKRQVISSMQEKKKINIILFDNMSFGCINNLEMGQGLGSFITEFRYRNEETGKLDGEFIPIDYAKVASGYGLKTYSVRTIEELREAIEDSKKQEVSTLIDIKVLPKTMTEGYQSWWRVGTPEVSNKESVQKAYKEMTENASKARKY